MSLQYLSLLTLLFTHSISYEENIFFHNNDVAEDKYFEGYETLYTNWISEREIENFDETKNSTGTKTTKIYYKEATGNDEYSRLGFVISDYRNFYDMNTYAKFMDTLNDGESSHVEKYIGLR